MDIQRLSGLIEKYKRGECSPQEKELLDNYLELFQNNTGEWNENEMGNQRIIEEKIYSSLIKNISKEKNHYFTRVFLSPSRLKRVASIIFFIILGTGILYISGVFRQNKSSVVWQEKVTSPGEKLVLTLSDGSNVTLNADSKLKYPDHFDNTSR
ncbi:MAG: hypothetical protein WB779_07775, partial [Ignavibacteriaceae bacterium]